MRLVHPEHPGRGVRLGYCLNLHAARTLDDVLEGLQRIALPLAERLQDRAAARAAGEAFGVGVWLPGAVALALDEDPRELSRLTGFLATHGLDAFTCNAFPYGELRGAGGDFHGAGLKERVFAPAWGEPERLAFTLAVARIAVAARRALEARWGSAASHGPHGRQHLSISTHAGGFGATSGPAERAAQAASLVACAAELARLERTSGLRVVLALEPEPRSSANDTRELQALHGRLRGLEAEAAAAPGSVQRHLGTCLDACHAAVELEDPAEALARATDAGTPLGKLQFSSALALAEPARHPAARERFLALAEPIYLHQVTARPADPADPAAPLPRATDLPEAAAAWAEDRPGWRTAREWRCHFHVPVDLGDLGTLAAGGASPAPRDPALAALGTTRADADALLAAALAAPERWGTDELHVELETYTWDVLPPEARGPGDLLDGLEREVRHVLARLAAAGWHPLVP